ncbi:peptidase M48-like protein [Sinobacterium caligoides]|uniref:Peptidase M48-like protein n=1 Tax=Sinobacterium caligoides TaxID=933926 RepID=A0A3N2DPX8_9GAMM|nr:M48 family metallopeptidase [Sinobacterium caligoides]ROS01884.1 peptidase M48-like protein [Sinobacterium caligoides]
MTEVRGCYIHSGCSAAQKAVAALSAEGVLTIRALDGSALMSGQPTDYRFADVIPGMAVDLLIADGALFTPDDASYRWPSLSVAQRLLERLESRWLMALLALIIIPLFIWWLVQRGIPAAADATVQWLPQQVGEELGQQTLVILDKTYLQPTALEQELQQSVRQRWQFMLSELQLPADDFQLHFRATALGANAFALADGSVIVTDALVQLMADSPDVLTAVLLHEIGHVVHQHNLKGVARGAATTLLYSMVLGDVEGGGELLLGAGIGLTQSAYSRDMEREADGYAHRQLQRLGLSAELFAEAMERLQLSRVEEGPTEQVEGFASHLQNYLSSHPQSQRRIDAARQAASNDLSGPANIEADPSVIRAIEGPDATLVEVDDEFDDM